MNCRICGAPSATVVGEVQYFNEYALQVCDCPNCHCRFTRHDNSVYELLHSSEAVTYYHGYRELAERCKSLFDQHDAAALNSYLRQTPKYRFILDELDCEPPSARMLEIGCSRGYLSSYFILKGCNILGVDISTAALEGARAAFGDHFAVDGAPEIAARGPYDVIYHVGLIGCVADPVGLTRQLLAMLRPGGRLVFNAPNIRGCCLRGQLWLDAAPPPDVVTLFPSGFWSQQFDGVVDVCEREEYVSSPQGLQIGLRRFFRRHWKQPDRRSFSGSPNASLLAGHVPGKIWQFFERAVTKVGKLTGLALLAPRQPSDFGLFVEITKHNGAALQLHNAGGIAMQDAVRKCV